MTPLRHHAHLERELRSVEARLRTLATPAPDPHGDDADQRTARQNVEDTVTERARLTETQRLILVALVKIDRGIYGLCETCERPIEAKRLAATPWVERCLIDQVRAERAGKRMGPLVDTWPGGPALEVTPSPEKGLNHGGR